MPFANRFFAQRGTTYPNALCSMPVCGPARAQLFTGQPGHVTGVLNNGDVHHGLRSATVFAALRRGGYETALAGKYLNGYPDPPTRGTFYVGGNANNPMRGAGALARWIERTNGPLFAVAAPISPHAGGAIPDKYQRAYRGTPRPLRTWLQRTRAVDDAFEYLIHALNRANRLHRTVVVLASDNGYHHFPHVLPDGGEVRFKKGTYYEEALHVTMKAAGPGIPAGTTDERIVVPYDITATILALAKAEMPTRGIPFTGEQKRDVALIQCDRGKGAWRGLADPVNKWTFARHTDTGEHVYFDRATDPGETTNAWDGLLLGRQEELVALLEAESAA